jgi:hypothetical protein
LVYLLAIALILRSGTVAVRHQSVRIIRQCVLLDGYFKALATHIVAVALTQVVIGFMVTHLAVNGIDLMIQGVDTLGASDHPMDHPLFTARGATQRVMAIGKMAISGYVKQLVRHNHALKSTGGAQGLSNKKVSKNKKRYFLVSVGIVFLCGILYPLLLRGYDRWQRLNMARLFALALQNQDFKRMVKYVLDIEQEKLGVNEESISKAFKSLKLPSMKLISLEALEVNPPLWAIILSKWSLSNGDQVSVIIEMTKENSKWRINFFFTFRRFCALKLRILGVEKITAFERSKEWSKNILKSAGIKGFVDPDGNIRSFDGKLLGIIKP